MTGLGAIPVLAVVLALAPPGPIRSDVVDPAGACTGTATWASGATAQSQSLARGDVVTIPRRDSVAWVAGVVGPTAGSVRTIDGQATLRLPPPLGGLALVEWSGESTETEDSGTYDYDLPAFVPAGVRLDLDVRHDENGQRFCTANVGLIIDGGPFDSPLTLVDLALLLGSLAGLVLLGWTTGPPAVGRIVVGAFAGLLVGLFGGLALVLFGQLSLGSPVVTFAPLAVLVIGAGWTWWSPLRRGMTNV